MKQLEQVRFLNDQDAAPVKELGEFDYANRFTLSTTYELPFGRGKALTVVVYLDDKFGRAEYRRHVHRLRRGVAGGIV